MLDPKPALLRLALTVPLALGFGLGVASAPANAQPPSSWDHTVGIGSYSGSAAAAQAAANATCESVADDMRSQDKAKVVGHKAILSHGSQRCRVWFASERDQIKASTLYRNWSSKTVVLEDTDIGTKAASISSHVDWMLCAKHVVDKPEYGSVVFQTSGYQRCWYKKTKDPAKLEYRAHRRTIVEVDHATRTRFRKLAETRVQGQDRYGNDIKKISGMSLDACTLRCAATAECKAYTWRATDKTCWLKRAGGNPSSAPINLYSGVIPSGSSNSGPG